MNNASYIFREPKNEPVYSYAPGTPERAALKAELEKQYNQCIEIPLIIGGKDVKTGDMGTVVMPTEHKHVLAKYHKVGKKEVQMAEIVTSLGVLTLLQCLVPTVQGLTCHTDARYLSPWYRGYVHIQADIRRHRLAQHFVNNAVNIHFSGLKIRGLPIVDQ